LARKTIAALEEEIKKVKEEEKCIKREKRYIEASKLTLFVIVGIVIFAFFIASYLAIITGDTSSATNNLEILTNWAQIVLVAIIAKSGFENLSKGKIRSRIIQKRIENNEEVVEGSEDFRNGV
jgi:heme/copper-type cytochrome/quinol oxidase subunit 3